MLEEYCEPEYIKNKIKRQKKKILKKRIIFFFIFFIFLIYLIFLYISKVVNPIILSYSEAQTTRLISQATNNSISKILDKASYSNMIDISYSNDGSISLIKANIESINKIGNLLVSNSQIEIDSFYEYGVYIPIGTLSGLSFLTGKGNKIKFTLNPLGSVVCEFNTEFLSTGINQTLHRIYASIRSSCAIILPFSIKTITTEIDFLLAENLIVGKIPETYLSISDLNLLK